MVYLRGGLGLHAARRPPLAALERRPRSGGPHLALGPAGLEHRRGLALPLPLWCPTSNNHVRVSTAAARTTRTGPVPDRTLGSTSRVAP